MREQIGDRRWEELSEQASESDSLKRLRYRAF